MSGWMLSYNGDDFDNGGLGSLVAKDNDTIELHYELTGADVKHHSQDFLHLSP